MTSTSPNTGTQAATPTRGPARLRIGEWIADPTLDELRRGDEVVKLEPRKMQLLLALAAHPGELVTTEDLFSGVWKDVVVTQSSIYQSVALLRRTLGDDTDEPRYIATVPRKGYRLIAPVSRVTPPDAETNTGGTSPAPAAPFVDRAKAAVPADLPASAGGSSAASAAAATGLSWRRRLLLGGSAAVVTLGAGLGVHAWRQRLRPATATVRIAVLPFKDLSAGEVEVPLAEGLAEDMVATLARHPQIRVTARTSVMQVRQASVADVRKALGVEFVLTGEFFRSTDRVRVTARLLAAGRDDPIWFEVVERPAADIGALPAQVTQGVLRALRLPPLAAAAMPSPQAFELTLLGHHALRPLTLDAVLKSRDYYQRAIDVDAAHAPAYAGLALTWVMEWQLGRVLYPRDAAARAQPLLDKALTLAPDLPEAHATAGFLAIELLQPEAASRHLKRAVELQPGNARSWFWLGSAARADGRVAEAIDHFGRSAELDPLNFFPHTMKGLSAAHAGRYDDALRYYQRARELSPDHPNTRWGAGIVGYARGQLDDAVRGYKDALMADSRRRDLWFELGWLLMDLGLADAADAAFEQATALSKVKAYGPLNAANVLFIRGQAAHVPAFLRRHDLPSGQYGHVGIHCALLQAAAGRAADGRRWLLDGIAQQKGDPLAAYGPWDAFRGYFPPVDIASVFFALGERDATTAFLEEGERFLDHHESRGNVWHAAQYQRARIEAMRGRTAPALEKLERAVTLGWRRAWWARVDPAMAVLREEARFVAALTEVDRIVATQRQGVAA